MRGFQNVLVPLDFSELSGSVLATALRVLDPQGRAKGQFVATGVRPAFAARLKSAGHDLPTHLFAQRVLAKA